jgi:hypothetical protein
VREVLAREVGWTAPREMTPLNDEQIKAVLTCYSDGQLSRYAAMCEIGFEPEQYAEFVDLMHRLSVPWPKVDRDRIEQEAEIVAQAIMEANDED